MPLNNNLLSKLRYAYAGKRVLVTGHTGFKGSWMLALLHYLGSVEVAGYALAPDTQPSLYELINGDTLCHSTIADIRDAERLRQEVQRFQPDFIFHLAAQPLVIDSYRQPVYTHEVNIIGTANVLEAMRGLQKPCTAVMITTDKVYHNEEWAYPYRENDRLGGHDPYAASKAAAELITDSYRKSFFAPNAYYAHGKAVATARAGNVIGGGDWAANRLVPDIARAMAAGLPLNVRNPHSLRPWQHVLEPLGGYLLLGAMLAQDPALYGKAYNFGPLPADTLSVEMLVQEAMKQRDGGSYTVKQEEAPLHEAGLLALDINLARRELGWEPRWDSARAIQYSMNWYMNYEQDPRGLTLRQVNDYFLDMVIL